MDAVTAVWVYATSQAVIAVSVFPATLLAIRQLQARKKLAHETD
jgi:hypothetical protein